MTLPHGPHKDEVGPYRRPAPRPPAPKTRIGDHTAARLGARALLPFQLGILLAFFLPSYEACHVAGEPPTPESLADFALGDFSVFTFALLAPVCLILADVIATLRTWHARRPVRRRQARFVALVPAAFLLYVSCAGAFEGGVVPGALSILSSLVLLPYLLIRATATRGHLRHFFGALAVLATQIPLAFLYVGAWIRHGDDFSGAVLHVMSVLSAVLVGVLAFALRPGSMTVTEALERARARYGTRPPRVRVLPRGSPFTGVMPSQLPLRGLVPNAMPPPSATSTSTDEAEREAQSDEEAAAWTARTDRQP